MAEQPADKSTKKKRLVKNPETFRERAIKAAEAGDQPKRASRAKTGLGRVFRFLGRPFAKLGRSKVFKLKPFRILGRGLRLIGKVIFPAYFRNSWRELRLVEWPSWKQSRALTSAVLVFAVIFGAAIAAVDYGLDKLFRDILLK